MAWVQTHFKGFCKVSCIYGNRLFAVLIYSPVMPALSMLSTNLR